MRIAISNIAWDPTDDAMVAEILQQYQVDAIDIAPGKYFADPKTATAQDIQAVRQQWQARGIEITGMQALLFGTTGLNVFGADDIQRALLAQLEGVCRVAEGLGATRLVFGSPRNRDRSGLSDDQALAQARDFFRRLGDVAATRGVQICLEPNPPRYGANFMIDSDSTAAVVRAVEHPAIRMQLDTGALTINEEDAARVLEEHAELIGHVHASEPDLVTLGEGGTNHEGIAFALTRRLPEQVVSIEMLPAKQGSNLAALERGVQVVVKAYRDLPEAAA